MYLSPAKTKSSPILLHTLLLGALLLAAAGSIAQAQTGAVIVEPAAVAADFRISRMGPDGNPDFDAFASDVVYNSAEDEYLVVWEGDDLIGDEGLEIYAQRVDAATGTLLGTPVRVSVMGPEGDPSYDGEAPAVAYNSALNQYLVVWSGDDNDAGLVEGELEIFGQRLDAAGNPIGAGDFRISDMGPNGNNQFDAREPDVAYNSATNQYLVVWHGDDNTATADEEREIFGQLLDAAGAPIGANDFRISDMGTDGNPAFHAIFPAIAFNPTNNQYLVVWTGNDTGEQEIFGQRLDAAGTAIGVNDFRISDMGPNGDPNYAAERAAVTHNPTNNRYFVVWSGDDNNAGAVNDEFEIYGQQLNAPNGAEIGGDIRLSDMGGIGSPLYAAGEPAVAYDSVNDEYLVVWRGDDSVSGLIDDEFEIFAQRLDAATGSEIVGNDLRVSAMGPAGSVNHEAMLPAIADNTGTNEALIVWAGDHTMDNEFEIYGQRFASIAFTTQLYLPAIVK